MTSSDLNPSGWFEKEGAAGLKQLKAAIRFQMLISNLSVVPLTDDPQDKFKLFEKIRVSNAEMKTSVSIEHNLEKTFSRQSIIHRLPLVSLIRNHY